MSSELYRYETIVNEAKWSETILKKQFFLCDSWYDSKQKTQSHCVFLNKEATTKNLKSLVSF